MKSNGGEILQQLHSTKMSHGHENCWINGLSEKELAKLPLKKNSSIVWVDENDVPRYGHVRWLGYLPEHSEEVTVGVEFIEPVGTGTGYFNKCQLFETKQNHASFIPLNGLILTKDFEETKTDNQHFQVLHSGVDRAENEMSRSCLVTLAEEAKETGRSKTQLISEQEAELYKYSRQKTTSSTSTLENNISERKGIRNSRRIESSAQFDVVERSSTINSNAEAPLEVGMVVEVVDTPPIFGVLRWIGQLQGKNQTAAGIELDEEFVLGTDGTYGAQRLFYCAPRRAMFIYLDNVRRDTRFVESEHFSHRKSSQAFGSMDCPDVEGDIAPPSVPNSDWLSEQSFTSGWLAPSASGKQRGIQGHHNSCYLDATLFSMFAASSAFDNLLYRPRDKDDSPAYLEVQRVLKDGIVNPLRKCYYVRADKILKLRTLLDQLGSVRGMINEEKDPEEFLNSMLQQTLRAKPFIKLSSGQESYFFQLFLEMESTSTLSLPTTQQLLEMSFLQSNIKLAEIPSCFILQMPRHGREYRMFNSILPSDTLDITDILDNYPRECLVCSKLAQVECKDCYKEHHPNYAFCASCCKKMHQHQSRQRHCPQVLRYTKEYEKFYHQQAQQRGWENITLPREKLKLFAVLCIRTSHYVCFVRSGPQANAPWLFFDSMADREGLQHGYNIPEVTVVPEVPEWLSEKNRPIITDMEQKNMPEQMRRLLCDAYMCFYHSEDMLLYK